MKRNLFATAALLVSLIFSGNAFAATYHVGTGQTYANLEALRTSLNSTLNPGDVIELHNDDSSLMRGFVFATGAGGTLVFDTLGVARTISYAGAVNQAERLFLNNSATGSGALTINLDKVTLDGFSTTNNFQAGSMIYSEAPLTVIGDVRITHSGTINPNNIINSGDPGPIRVNNRVTFDGNVVFDGNLGGWSSGLALYAGSNTSNITAEFMGTAQFTNNFNLNTGQISDGALNNSSGKDIVFYDTVLFDSNRASGNNSNGIQASAGAGLCTWGGNTTFEGHATFNNNKSWFVPPSNPYQGRGNIFGGAMTGMLKPMRPYGNPSFTFDQGATFTNNSAFSTGTWYGEPNSPCEGYGGAIALTTDIDPAVATRAALVVNAGLNSNTFSNNQANGRGGAIYGEIADVTFSGNTIFSNNDAAQLGGAIYLANKAVWFDWWGLTDADYDGIGNTLSLTLANAGDTMVFTNNQAGVEFDVSALDIINAPGTGPVIDRTNAFGNDLWLYGTAITINTTDVSNTISMDGGIRSYAFNNVNATLTKTGAAGALMMVGNSWSVVNGLTDIQGGTFHLGKDALWGKGAETTINRTAALSENGVGTFNAGAGATLSFEFNRGEIGEQWGEGHSVIFADTITIDDLTQVALVYDDGNGNLVDGSQNKQNIQWQGGKVYDLAVATTSLSVTTKLDRGAYGPGDSQYLRDLRYDRDADGNVVLDGDLLSYGIEAFKMSDVIGSDPPYYDPSLKNRILARRLGWMPRCPKSECGVGNEPECCGAVTRGNAQRKPQWNAWLEGYGTGGNVRENAGMPGLEYSAGGMLGGFERQMSRNNRFGIYYGYGNSWMTGNSISYQGKGENTFGVYLRASDRWGYTLASANLGWNNYRVTRTLQGANLNEFRARFSANTGGAYLERGFDKKVSTSTILTPFGALQYAHLGSDRFEETSTTGANDLRQTAEIQYESLRSLLGARSQTLMYDRLVWQNSIHWEHELLKRNGVSRNDFLTDDPTMRAQTIGNYGGRDWCVYGTGLEFEMKPHLTLNAGYDLSFNKNAVFHTGMAGLTYKF